MSTIFTRANAARKVIDLFDTQCGIPRSDLYCDARLESDLGVVGDDTYALLESMHEEGIDMTEFDCHDRITPEGVPVLPMLGWLFIVVILMGLFFSNLHLWADWIVFPVAPVAIIVATVVAYRIAGAFSTSQHEELRVRDFVLSVEAGRWRSPKAEQGVAAKPSQRRVAE